ncbi:MAG: GNAT family N-acetyltransferase [Saprospiraceae bacterium]|jgi:ribosomal-protein-alanine N-acetyltransferase
MTLCLETPRLEMPACHQTLCEAILRGDVYLGEFLQARIASGWNSFGDEIFAFNLARTQEDPEAYIWWSYLVIEKFSRTLIGACGYKGRPNKMGEVEIGYEIAPDYRNRGYATELSQCLIQYARRYPEINTVKAHTLSFESPSTQVLRKCGFTFTEELFDPDDGILWQWKLPLKPVA